MDPLSISASAVALIGAAAAVSIMPSIAQLQTKAKLVAARLHMPTD
jgi:hypothetical protein